MAYSLSKYLKKGYRHKLLILGIMFCCFFVRRVGFPQLLNNFKLFYVPAYWRTDVDGWAAIGKNLMDGKGYRNKKGELTAERGPVFPIFLALIFGLSDSDDDYTTAITIQMLLDTISCWLIWLFALKMFGNRHIAALAAAIWVIYFPAIVLDLYLYSEPLFTVILFIFNFYMISIMDKLSWQRFLMAGILLGIATLCRPITTYFPFFVLPVLIWIFRRQLKKILYCSLVFLLGFGSVLLPWTISNYKHFKKIIPASTLLGHNLYLSLMRMPKANYLELEEFYDYYDIQQLAQKDMASQGISLEGKSEAERDLILRQAAWRLIKKYPYRYTLICLNRLSVLWFNLDYRGYSRLRGLAMLSMQIPILAFCIAAFVFFRGRWSFVSIPILLLILYNTIGYMLVLGAWRFNVPIMPYIIIFSSYAMVSAASRIWPKLSDGLTNDPRSTLKAQA